MTLNVTAWRLARLWSALERAADLAERQIESPGLLPSKCREEEEMIQTADDLVESQDCGGSCETRCN